MTYRDALFIDDDTPADQILAIARQINTMCVTGEISCHDPEADKLMDEMVLRLQSVSRRLQGHVVTLDPPTAVVWIVS